MPQISGRQTEARPGLELHYSKLQIAYIDGPHHTQGAFFGLADRLKRHSLEISACAS